MFTGITEEVGKIISFDNDTIKIECQKILEQIQTGDSICVSGVCQTVVDYNSNSFTARLSQTTRNITTFSNLHAGDYVNLERALTLSSRLGGHIVSGHVEGIGTITNINKLKDFYNIFIDIPQELVKYVVKKGSITVDGISLTVAEISNNNIMVSIIPHTFLNTTFKTNPKFVNIETDILSKYVEKILSTNNNINSSKSTIDEEFLKANGF